MVEDEEVVEEVVVVEEVDEMITRDKNMFTPTLFSFFTPTHMPQQVTSTTCTCFEHKHR